MQTARTVRLRIGAVLEWAVAMNLRTDDPADRVLPVLGPQNEVVEHWRALPHREVAAAIRTLRASQRAGVGKLAFEFLILTVARSGEVRGAVWTEIDTTGRVWTVPAERMKVKRDHRVPLCRRAIEILDAARALAHDGNPVVFANEPGKHLDDPFAGSGRISPSPCATIWWLTGLRRAGLTMTGRTGQAGGRVPSGDPRDMDGGSPLVPQPLEKYGTTPEGVKNPSWLRRVFLGELGARRPDVFLKRLARAFDSPPTGFHGLSQEIGYRLDGMFQRLGAYDDPRVLVELWWVDTAVTTPDDSEDQARKEGLAEYVRRWLSGDPSLDQIAPEFTAAWNRWMQSDDLERRDRACRDAIETARVEIDVWQGLTPIEQLHLMALWKPRSLRARTADAVQCVRDEGVMTVGAAMARRWGPGALLCLAWLTLMYAAMSYQRDEPHMFTINDSSGEPVTVECWLNEWATGVDIYIRTNDGLLEPVEYLYFDSPDGANAPEAFAEFDADALMPDLGLPPRVPHPLRDAAVALCERFAPSPPPPEAAERWQRLLEQPE